MYRKQTGNLWQEIPGRIWPILAMALLFLAIEIDVAFAQSNVTRSLGQQFNSGLCKVIESLNWIQRFAIAAGIVAVTILGILTYTGRFQLNKLLQYSGAVMLVAAAPALIRFLIGDEQLEFCSAVTLDIPYIKSQLILDTAQILALGV